MGLETMRARAADLNASLTLDSSSGDGTTVAVFLRPAAKADG
jgi:signal transduction histidine kinase